MPSITPFVPLTDDDNETDDNNHNNLNPDNTYATTNAATDSFTTDTASDPHITTLPATQGRKLTNLAAPCLLILGCIVLGIIMSHTSVSTKQYTEVTTLFVLRDAGESYGLLPLIQARNIHQETQQAVVVVPHGTNPFWKTMQQQNATAYGTNFHLLSDLVQTRTENKGDWFDRNVPLNSHELSILFRLFPNLETIVLGLVSMVQTSIAQEAKSTRRRINIIGFDDGLSLGTWDDHNKNKNTKGAPSIPQWSSVAAIQNNLLNELWVTSTKIQHAVTSSLFYQHSIPKCTTNVIATGSPALLNWPKQVKETSKKFFDTVQARIEQAMAQQSRHQKKDPKNKTIWIHLFGGYDDIDSTEYSDSLKMVASSISQWENNYPLVSFSPHPGGFPSSVEKKIFAKYNISLITFEMDENIVFPSSVFASMCNVSISHFSTCGLQSLTVGTPHVFVTTPSFPVWDNIVNSLIVTVDKEGLLEKAIVDTRFVFNTSLLTKKAGIPLDPLRRMLERMRGNRSAL